MSYLPVQSSEPPLDWPHYGIGFGPAIKRAFTKYATFSGRASRSEYWFFALFNVLAYLVFGGISMTSSIGAEQANATTTAASTVGSLASIPFVLFILATLVPSLAIGSRRLHDAGYSGALLLLHLIPYLGSFIVLTFTVIPTSLNAGRYGPPAPAVWSYPGYGTPHPSYAQPDPYSGGYDQVDFQPYPYVSSNPYGSSNSYGNSHQPHPQYFPTLNDPGQNHPGQNDSGQHTSWPESPWQNPDRPDSSAQGLR